jgi:hypothetical protein
MHAGVFDDAGLAHVSRSDLRHVAFCRSGEHRHPELVLRRSIPGLHIPLSTLRVDPRGPPRMTWGRCSSLRLAP